MSWFKPLLAVRASRPRTRATVHLLVDVGHGRDTSKGHEFAGQPTSVRERESVEEQRTSGMK